MCSYGYGNIPPVDPRHVSGEGLIFISLAPGADHHAGRRRSTGWGCREPPRPRKWRKRRHIGELYFAAPDKLVTVNGTIVAPLKPSPNAFAGKLPTGVQGMKRSDLVKQVEASRRKTPDADGRRVAVESGRMYIVVRSDGKAFIMGIDNVGPNGISPSFFYVGRLKSSHDRQAACGCATVDTPRGSCGAR